MNSFRHAFLTTFRRFRWELIFFMLLGTGIMAGIMTGAIQALDPMQLQLRTPQLGRIEILAACWMVLRLMFSDPVLLTLGGWRTRPIPRFAALGAPFAVLAVAFLPAVLLRITAIQRSVAPDRSQWFRIFNETLLPTIGALALMAVVLRTVGTVVAGRDQHPGKKLVLGAVCVAALVLWFLPASARLVLPGLWGPSLSNSGGDNYGGCVLGIQELLPSGGKYLGDWETYSPPCDRMREVFRMPLAQGLVVRRPGIVATVNRMDPAGRSLELEVEMMTADRQSCTDLLSSVMVLRYAGNSYAFRNHPNHPEDSNRTPRVAVFPVVTIQRAGTFPSPIGLFWNQRGWDDLLAGAELIFFLPDNRLPKITVAHRMEPDSPPTIRQPGLAGEVEILFDGLDFEMNMTEALKAKANDMPREAMPHVLARHPWSDNAWDTLVRPFLLRNATEANKPLLLERLASEPRLGEIFVAKGWTAEAMPLLRSFAADRLPLGVLSLTALAQERDPSLAAALAALAARLDTGVEELESLLRDQPGFDWQTFARDGWVRRKYTFRFHGTIEPFNFWAAQEGDLSAFRQTAQQAARGKKLEAAQLKVLVAGEHADLISELRQNIDRIRFDPTTRKWEW